MFEPIFRRETTRTVRRRRYFLLRALYAFALLWLMGAAYSDARSQAADSAGEIDLQGRFADMFFVAFSFAQLTAVIVLTPGYLAPAVSALKSQRILEQLLLTRLRTWQILGGLWLGRCLCVVLIVLAGVPILAFAGLFGGIDYGRLALLTLVAIGCLFSSAAVAAAMASLARNARQAVLYSYIVIGFLLALPWAWRGAVEIALGFLERWILAAPNLVSSESRLGRWPYECLLFVHPYSTYLEVMSANRIGPDVGRQLGWFACVQGLLTVTGLLLATYFLGRSVAGTSTRQAARQQALSASRVRRWRVGAVGDDPMLWKEWYFDHRPRNRWLSPLRPIWHAGLASLPVVLAADTHWLGGWTPYEWTSTFRAGALCLFTVTLLQVAVRAATCIGSERDIDCWSSLMPTPLSAREIVRAKLVGAVKPMAWNLVLLLPSWLLAIYWGAISPWALPGLVVVPAVVACSIAAVGVWLSLSLRGTHRATVGTIGILLGLGAGIHVVAVAPVIAGLTLALAYAGFDVSLAQTLMQLGSLGVLLYSIPIDPHQVAFSAESAVVVIYCLLQLLVLTGLTLVLQSHCVQQFSRWTGRTDEGHRRSLESAEVVGLAGLGARLAP